MLDEALVPTAWARFGLESVILINDPNPTNGPNQDMRDWIRNHPEFQTKYWPKNSWDINPFTKVWNDFVGSLRLQRLQPQNQDELWEGVQELWGYRAEKPLFWEGILEAFKLDLEKAVKNGGKEVPFSDMQCF